MKKNPVSSVSPMMAVLLAMVALPWIGHADIPLTLNHQGVIKIGTTPFAGTGYFRFAIYSPGINENVWTNDGSTTEESGMPDTAVAVPVSNGIYSVRIGDTALPNMGVLYSDIFGLGHDDLVLRIWFDDQSVVDEAQLLQPDQPLSSAPYAYEANNAAKLAGQPASAYVRSEYGYMTYCLVEHNGTDAALEVTNSSAGAGTAVYASADGEEATAVEAYTGGDESNCIDATATGYNGTGVAGRASGDGGRGVYAGSSGPSGTGLHAYASAATGRAIYARAEGTDGKGVQASVSGDTAEAVYAEASGHYAKAVYGIASYSGAATNHGGYFEARANTGQGVYAKATGAQGQAIHAEATGTEGQAVYAEVPGDTATAVKGFASYAGPTQNFGGRFEARGHTGHGVHALATGDQGRGLYVEASGYSGAAIETFTSGPNGRGAQFYNDYSGNNCELAGPDSAGYFEGDVVTTDEYTYQSAKDYRYYLNSGDFTVSTPESKDGWQYFTHGGLARDNPTVNGIVWFYAGVHLPQGATLQDLTMYWRGFKLTLDTRIEIVFYRRPFMTNNQQLITNTFVVTGRNCVGMHEVVEDTLFSTTIDNTTYAYYMVLKFDDQESESGLTFPQFFGAAIDYSVDTVAP